MARAARRMRSAVEPAPLNEEGTRQALIDAVVSALLAKEIVVTVRGPFMTAVMMNDSNYKNKTIMPETELIFKGMRAGARSNFIFEFEPIEATEYQKVEFAENKMFQAVPTFEAQLVNALGFYDEMSWQLAKAKYVKTLAAEREVAAELQAAEIKEKNVKDADWGIF